RCRAFAVVAPPRFRFSHVTAARLHRMPLPRRLENRTELDVSVHAGAAQPRRRGIVGHRLVLPGECRIAGLPVVTAEVAWLQLATLLDLDDLVIAGDALVRRKQPASSVPLLAAMADAASG